MMAGCYHDVVGTRGKDCEFNVAEPPCCHFDTTEVIKKINQML